MMHYRSREKHLDAKQGESLVFVKHGAVPSNFRYRGRRCVERITGRVGKDS